MMIDTKQLSGVLAAISCLILSGCMGAPLAQQLLASVVMNGADNIVNNAYEAQQREAINHRVLKDSPPDDYWASFVTAGFQNTTPTVESQPIIDAPVRKPNPEPLIQTSPFVRVEVWNMLIGEEKLSVLEKAYAAGSPNLPPKKEWGQVRIATGALEGRTDQPIVFLVPEEIGKLSSGQQTIVQLANTGDLNIARYVSD